MEIIIILSTLAVLICLMFLTYVVYQEYKISYEWYCQWKRINREGISDAQKQEGAMIWDSVIRNIKSNKEDKTA